MKITPSPIDSIAAELVDIPVPGATPKRPFSGFVALSLPSLSGLIQTMSSPRVSAFQPGSFG